MSYENFGLNKLQMTVTHITIVGIIIGSMGTKVMAGTLGIAGRISQ